MVSKECLRHTRLGELSYKKRNYKKALEYFEKAISIEPKYDKAWYNKGLTLSHLNDDEGAIKCYDIVIKINPENKSAWNNKGLILVEKNSRVFLIEYRGTLDLYDTYESAVEESINTLVII